MEDKEAVARMRSGALLAASVLAVVSMTTGVAPAAAAGHARGPGRPAFVGWWDGLRPPGTVIRLSSDVLFTTDSAVLSPAGADALGTVAQRLLTFGGAVTVIGYCDSTGTPAHNDALSLERAQAVGMELARRGAKAAQITTLGRGASDPVSTNATPEGRALNRRVEVIFNTSIHA